MNGEIMTTMQRLKNWSLLALAVTLAIAALGIPSAHAQTYTDIHDFDTPLLASPQYPGMLAQGHDGNLYGTAPLGGNAGRGGVFRVSPTGGYSILFDFDVTHGSNPYSGLTLGTDGNFYGAAFNNSDFIFGNVFQISPSGILTVLHSFQLVEGVSPYAPPIQGADGNFYGTTSAGGLGWGSVYKLTPTGVFTVLYTFDNTHGATPIAQLIQGNDGNFYGTTKDGGTFGFGTAFRMTPAGALTVLYNFDSTHGASIYAPLLQGLDGNFYGTARNGGTKNNGGVVFKLTKAKKAKLTVLYNFDATGATTDGVRPYAGLIQASDGNFYGVTSAGGANAVGTLYRITKAGIYSRLYNFASATGSLPYATLRQHTNGKLYGEATSGGATGHGALFSVDLGLKPFVTIVPTSGKVGDRYAILGQGLSATINVEFLWNGNSNISNGFSVESDNCITGSVPGIEELSVGPDTGVVRVYFSPSKKLTTLEKFRITPVIHTFSPSSGLVGTQVTITGNSLTQVSNVTFGGVKATVFSADSYTQITITVPVKAKTGKIQVTTAGGTADSPTTFTVNGERIRP
jgi:uncharacterized repeat protein (TIGR03803 family)